MKYDVIIVGAGSAGAPLAALLSDEPSISVLLLDEGPYYPTLEQLPEVIKTFYGSFMGTENPYVRSYPAQYSAQQSEPKRAYRGMVVGGGSAINGSVFLRGLAEDFDSWSSLGNEQWAYDRVLPFFCRLECDMDFGGYFHGKEGPIPVRRVQKNEQLPAARAFQEASISKGFIYCPDLHRPYATGVGPIALNDRDGTRINTAMAYLNPRRQRINLSIRGNVTVRRILFNGRQAIGVEAESGGETFSVYGRETVLSAGAIASPFLLLHSGVGPSRQLQHLGIPLVHDLPAVGENLGNHPTANLSFPSVGGTLHENLPNQVLLRYTARNSATPNDMTISLESRPSMLSGTPHARLALTLQLPKSVGRLYLTNREPSVPPSIRYGYYENPWDLQRMREGTRLSLCIAKDPALQEVLDKVSIPTGDDLASDQSLDKWLLTSTSTYQHSCGTCKMGVPSDRMAVVDQYCRVYGLESLRVVDASIMPHIVRANLNATCVMIGERVAAWIKEDLAV